MGLLDFFRRKKQPGDSQADFAHMLMAWIREQGINDPMHYEADSFRIVVGRGTIMNLHNAYRDFHASPQEEQREVLRRYTAFFGETESAPGDFSQARTSLMPVIKPRIYLDHASAARLPDSPVLHMAWREFGPDAILLLAIDSEHSISMIGEKVLQDWGVSFEEALAVALDNLRERSPDSFARLNTGVVAGAWGDAYDSSRILLPDMAYRAGDGVEQVVMVPERGLYLLAPLHAPAVQLAMVALARTEMEGSGRPLSAMMYRYLDGRAVPYQPDDTAVAAALRAVERISLARDYADQQQELEQRYQAAQEDIFVASYSLQQDEASGQVFSYSVWTRDVLSLLPCTDWVALVDSDTGRVRWQRWPQVMEAAGEMARPEEGVGYPPRMRVSGFLPESGLAAAMEQPEMQA
ncbi:hypothetical protein [Massilia sp. erpn]|uniref:hypothetical protein n=1 Tax=Massilia sp. erpn TaxID=2738142 RepID=UPI00210631D3|nr:hypothetical protein [Massilia sp. erpn]UTY59996.1 hypothetical protein HPQ68_24080 [Massilia sp. erpn]